jgi:hypothetical protein
MVISSLGVLQAQIYNDFVKLLNKGGRKKTISQEFDQKEDHARL